MSQRFAGLKKVPKDPAARMLVPADFTRTRWARRFQGSVIAAMGADALEKIAIDAGLACSASPIWCL